MSSGRVPDYVVIGHLCVDRTPVGDALGGSALYCALAAARFGARVGVLSRANVAGLSPRLRDDLAAVTSEVELIVQESAGTTTFTNEEVAGRRKQTIHAWGEPIDLNGLPAHWRSAGVVHLAPIAQEIDLRQVGRLSAGMVGCTPQGWMRTWPPERLGPVRQIPLRLPPDVVARIDALVVSAQEYVDARDVVAAVGQRGLSVVTRGDLGVRVLDRGRAFEMEAFKVTEVDPAGAGDTFAAVLFAARSLGESTVASVRYAAAAAALKVSGWGVQATPRREAVERLIDSTRQLP
ncbi:MAG: carbohydrate kinase [Chloroflexi bacterium]|nr:MAG: carbohydrate kinase [Chloroflexota bacterium]